MRVVLHKPEIAANFGNILRSCACFGVALDVIEPTGFPLAARDVRRAAMDYGREVTLTRHASWDIYKDRSNARRVLFTTRGATPLTDLALHESDHLIFGSESSGVPQAVHADCDVRAIIPLQPDTRSLNLSNAVAIALFEALRQTGDLAKGRA